MEDQIIETDVLVIGGGGAGERAALEAIKRGTSTTIVVKGELGESGCTARAVSELSAYSAALGDSDPRDKPYFHFRDTVDQGRSLANQKLIRILSEEAPNRFKELVEMGARFKKRGNKFEQLLADASSIPRACHFGADTGREIASTLKKEILKSEIRVIENTLITKLLTFGKTVVGATGIKINTGEFITFKAKSTVLATGGGGQLFSLNAQPPDVTGDGFALAYNAGADLINMELIQIGPALVHPIKGYLLVTNFWKLNPRIYNKHGEEIIAKYLPSNLSLEEIFTAKQFAFPFMFDYPSMYLDIAMHTEIKKGNGTEHNGVYLDVSHNSLEKIESEVPVSYKWLKERGIDISKQPIEIAPVVQCFIGGVSFNEHAESTVPGLYVCGEVAGGAHGAARPGGNLLAISQVFGFIAGREAAKRALPIEKVKIDNSEIEEEKERIFGWLKKDSKDPEEIIKKIQKIMWGNVSAVRNKNGLESTLKELNYIKNNDLFEVGVSIKKDLYKTLIAENMVKVAELITRAALLRSESRGCHYREDFPFTDNFHWLKTIHMRLEDGKAKTFLMNPIEVNNFYIKEEDEI
ncbi:MAG: FAD-binding protein [Atribacterota bacterium]|nr:FAD-binding protein [Atribacterota bacterium]